MCVHTIELTITFIITPIIISAIEGHAKKKFISVHDVIFRFGTSRYSILEFFVLGFGMLIFHVTYLNCLSMSKISMTLLLPMGVLVCLLLVLFGFLFLVVIEIGSLAHFMCSLMLICFAYFEVFQTLSSRILCLLC
jgi:hypothetical protein